MGDDNIEAHAEEEAHVFQLTAQAVDEATSSVIDAVANNPLLDPMAVVSGLSMATVRLIIARGFADGEPPSVRGVITIMLKAANQAAEALLAQPPPDA